MNWPDASPVCHEIAAHVTGYEATLNKISAAVQNAKLFLAASDEAFTLAKIVRCATGSGIVKRESLEAEKRLALPLRRFREAWADARRAVQKIDIVTYALLGVSDTGKEYLNTHLANDPTNSPTVDMANLERPAGWLAKVYRIMRRDEVQIRSILHSSLGGQDPDRVARELAQKHKVSLPDLATMIGFLKARDQQTVEETDPENPKFGGDEVNLPPEWLVEDEAKKTAARWRKQKQRSSGKSTMQSDKPARRVHKNKATPRR